MDDGRIVQRGKHDELLAQGGLYKEIHDLQLNENMVFEDEEEIEEVEKPDVASSHSLS